MILPGKPLWEFREEVDLGLIVYSNDGNRSLRKVPEDTAIHAYHTFEAACLSMQGHDEPIWTTLDVTEIKRRQRDKEVAEFDEWYQ